MGRGRHDYERAMVAIESIGYTNLHGRVLMQDDFEVAPLKWYTQGAGIWTVTRQATSAYNGGFGVQLDTTSAVPPASHYAMVYRYIPIDVTKRLQLELFWRADDIAILDRLETWIEYYDGAEYHRVALQYDGPNQRWNHYDEPGGMTYIPGSEQTFIDDGWNELTLSADFMIDEYIRMKSNNMDINMGGVACRHTGNPAGAHARIAILAANTTANQLLVSVDDVAVKEIET